MSEDRSALLKGRSLRGKLGIVDSYCCEWIAIAFEIRIWITMEVLVHLYLNYCYLGKVISNLVFVFEFLRS